MTPPAGGDRQVFDFYGGGARDMNAGERSWFGDRADRERVGPFDHPQAGGLDHAASMWSDLMALIRDERDDRVDDIAFGIGGRAAPDRVDHGNR